MPPSTGCAHDALAGRTATEALHAELAAVRDLAARATEGVDALRAEVQALRGETAAARTQADLANAVAERAKLDDGRVQALQADVKSALAQVEDLRKRSAAPAPDPRRADASGGDNVGAMFREILGLAARENATKPRPLPRAVETPKTPERAARVGFDDDPQPLAILGLDGRFRELNPGFARLVGYQEDQFTKATWPSPHDRHHYAQQQQQLAELASGELEGVVVQSTYMHGQGLMVPVIGELTVVKNEDGAPSHLLLRAEERERTG